jgi:Tol biopolymer transport system component
LWVAPGGDASQARAITSNQNIEHGRLGIRWTRDGKLVYTSNLDGKEGIWTIGAHGEDPRVLTEMHDDGPEVSSDGRYLFVGSMRSGYQELWRMDLDGGNPKQLTDAKGVDVFTISPDDHWLIYEPYTGGLYKISIDGGTPTSVPGVTGYVSSPKLSPDGKLLAYTIVDERTRQPKLAVIKFEDGTPFKDFDQPFTSGDYFEWSADGRSLIYKNTIGGVGNLWSQPLAGGPAKQITDFKSDLIYYFAYSRDGKQLALARGNYTRDAVLITDSN